MNATQTFASPFTHHHHHTHTYERWAREWMPTRRESSECCFTFVKSAAKDFGCSFGLWCNQWELFMAEDFCLTKPIFPFPIHTHNIHANVMSFSKFSTRTRHQTTPHTHMWKPLKMSRKNSENLFRTRHTIHTVHYNVHTATRSITELTHTHTWDRKMK